MLEPLCQRPLASEGIEGLFPLLTYHILPTLTLSCDSYCATRPPVAGLQL